MTQIAFNLILAWVTLALAALCAVVWGLRLLGSKRPPQSPLRRLNRRLRRPHKWLGAAMCATGLAHGLLSSRPVLSYNPGTLLWAAGLLLGLNYLLRRRLRNPGWIQWHRLLTVTFATLLVIHIVHEGGFLMDDLLLGRLNAPGEGIRLEQTVPDTAVPSAALSATAAPTPGPTSDTAAGTAAVTAGPSPSPSPEPTPAGAYQDGVYIGAADGFGPDLTVRVTIENGLIASVEVISHHERNERYYGLPMELIPQRIVEEQSPDVDTVTGATYTSRGIINAVRDALSQAGG